MKLGPGEVTSFKVFGNPVWVPPSRNSWPPEGDLKWMWVGFPVSAVTPVYLHNSFLRFFLLDTQLLWGFGPHFFLRHPSMSCSPCFLFADDFFPFCPPDFFSPQRLRPLLHLASSSQHACFSASFSHLSPFTPPPLLFVRNSPALLQP